MAHIVNDISISSLRDAGAGVAKDARTRAFSAGSTVAYIEDGQLVRESMDGTKIIVSMVKSKQIKVRKRVWKIG